MITVTAGTPGQLDSGVEHQLAAYRHKVFVDQLGWKLPLAEAGLERDQFDRPDTLYVIAFDRQHNVCGCGRLLPTTKPYLLGSVFPHLMGEQQLPCATEVWELSRYSTQTVDSVPLTHEQSRRRFRSLLRAIVEAAIAHGAKRLITFTVPTLERLSRQLGIHVHRVGPPQLIDGSPVVAMWVELDEQTCSALDLVAGHQDRDSQTEEAIEGAEHMAAS